MKWISKTGLEGGGIGVGLYWNQCGYMSEIKTPLTSDISSLSTIEPIDHQAYWPSSLSTIMPINHWAYKPLCLSTIGPIEPIDHWAYWPSSLLTIKPIDHQAYGPSSPLTIKSINLWSSFATFKPFGLLVRAWTYIHIYYKKLGLISCNWP